ncbi:cobaltochelatase subunit CobN [Rhabdothermincola sediminis]|uniref:cobaltochelatase subunit CobN n=1 Tax=Rhabdothermincola sediminis TaxID=2751370 RepID=UPI001AA06E52|nr:cobaltochelatase subunit CobN [Rhabdothermincola sediminis]
MSEPGVILYVTNVDTEVLALRIAVEGLPAGCPPVRARQTWRFDPERDLDGARCVVVRLLGGRRLWEDGFNTIDAWCRARGVPLLAFGGEAVPDAPLAARSTVPASVHREGFRYLVQGGPANLGRFMSFIASAVLGEDLPVEPPEDIPTYGVWRRSAGFDDGRPRVGVVFYRAHLVAGNTGFVDELADALEARGVGVVVVWCYSLRGEAGAPVVELLRGEQVELLVTTVLAAGGANSGAGTVGAPGGAEGEPWDVEAIASLDVPVLHAASAGQSSQQWAVDPNGLGPYDAAAGVAIPEMDGRVIGPVFAFNEVVDDGDDLGTEVRAYRCIPDRLERLAGIAARLVRLRRTPAGQRRIALVLSAYPTRHGRLANAVGLDTPRSVMRILDALATAGYRVGEMPEDGDALMAELEAGFVDDTGTVGVTDPGGGVGRLDTSAYRSWFETLPPQSRREVEQHWGPAPGTHRVHQDALVFSGLELGNVLVAVQPPRGYGDDPVAIYHAPNLPPTHHYLGFYRWLDAVWGADAVVHVGKHGTLEWLPGKALALSAACFPDIAIGELPLFYPFLVNDPGEGSQAKRRAHAVIIDHLSPPLTRAETYGELARLEQLLDEHSQLQVLDPSKLPALRERIWATITEASLDRDLGIEELPGAEAFDDLLVELDGYLCTLKDAQIRGGLHVFGEPPCGDALVDMVLAATRLPQGSVPSLRATVASELGLRADDPRHADAVEAECRRRVQAAAERGWRPVVGDGPTVQWVCEWLVPMLQRTGDELANLLRGLDGRFVPAGPAGTLSRGGAHVLPTGRNFYSLDPQALPTRLAWETGVRLADALLARHLGEHGSYPRSVGLVVWGTAAMRTQGDDIAEALALLGVRPVWDQQTRRVVGLEPIPLAELGRPRIDVTLRISGFFRDAFPNLVRLVDDAARLVASLEGEPPEQNALRFAPGDPRVFGPAPGAYGAGIIEALQSGRWADEDDLAAIYAAWSGWSYGRHGYGVADEAAMRRRFALIDVAVKNQDDREHDIFDSEDYLADHGGMVALVRALTGCTPAAVVGDSSDPARPVVRSLAEEAARVLRSRALNPRWIAAMGTHGYRGAAELAATVDCLVGYDATTGVVDDWMYERITTAYVSDPEVRDFFRRSNPAALCELAERLLDAARRGMWQASEEALAVLADAVVEAEGWEELR